MQSKAEDVTAYIQEAPAERQPSLTRLRALCLEVLDGFEEGMQYGMAVYQRDDGAGVAFANQKGYISLYINVNIVQANRASLAGLNVGKSCIRYSNPRKMDFDVIRKLLEDTAHAGGEVHESS